MLMDSVAASERARFFTIKSPEHASRIQWFHSNAMDGGSSTSTTDTANKRMLTSQCRRVLAEEGICAE